MRAEEANRELRVLLLAHQVQALQAMTQVRALPAVTEPEVSPTEELRRRRWWCLWLA